MDSKITIEHLKLKVKHFVDERDWQQYHTLKNLSMNISIEAAELMEIFVWLDSKESIRALETERQEIENEVADIAFTLFNFCLSADIDLSKALEHKLALNAQKYPIEKSKGKASKHTTL